MKKRILALSMAAALSAGVVACTGNNDGGEPSGKAPEPTRASSVPAPADPLKQFQQDWEEGQIDGEKPAPLVHAKATEPAGFDLGLKGSARPDKLLVYLACSPGGEYTVSVGEKQFSGTCSRDGDSTAAVPLAKDINEIKVNVASGATYWILALPWESDDLP
ncbi:MAG: hypothetical protein ACTIJJ_13710 [Galactobacter sp.]